MARSAFYKRSTYSQATLAQKRTHRAGRRKFAVASAFFIGGYMSQIGQWSDQAPLVRWKNNEAAS
jgi:hypothetical protein